MNRSVPGANPIEVTRWDDRAVAVFTDILAVEEPLEIRLHGRSLAVVMRTPGNDRELAAGFLLTEGIIGGRAELLDLIYCGEAGAQTGNVLDGLLAPGVVVDWDRLQRHTFASSSCGLCGKASIESIRTRCAPLGKRISPDPRVLAALPDRLRAAQSGFAATGGVHASGLFSPSGEVEVVREDVGRHNALDKVVGWACLGDRLPLHDRILLVSGRVSFELMQKALVAGISCVAAISAPTSLAVEFAREAGQTLVGFVRGERMNLYAGTFTN